MTANLPLTREQLQQYVPSAFATAPHSSRSSRYTYIPSGDVIDGLMQSGFMPFKATESKYRDSNRAGFTKHMIRFRQTDSQLQVNDSFFEVGLLNSHDGSSAYQLFAGIFRLKCLNGMAVSEGEFASVRVRHSGNVITQVIDGAKRIIDHGPKVLEQVTRWNGLQLTAPEQAAFADSARILRFADAEGKVETPIQAAQLLRPRRVEDQKDDLWHVFNRVQENTIKGGLSAYGRDKQNRQRRVTTKTINGIDQDVKLNRALWQLAEKMEELKSNAATHRKVVPRA